MLLAKPADWPDRPRIVAALDPGHLGDKPAALDHDILDWAALVAAHMGGEVHAVHAFFPAALVAATTTLGGMPLVAGGVAGDLVETERRRIAGALEAIVVAQGLPAGRVHLEQGAANEVLPRVAERLQATLMVMGAVSRSRLQEVFLGSTAERVLDRIGCDVLVVKPGDFTEKLPF